MIRVEINKKLHGANGDMSLDIDLGVKEGGFIALAGKSGSGKTTLLRILAGLENANGQISIGKEIWQNNTFALPPQKRRIGFVFQDYALFPNMSVEENLLYVNKDKPLAKELLDLTELTDLKKRLPSSLSGGQKQRVALIRALMKRPKLLLLDEPLSALDPSLRSKLQTEISKLHNRYETTTIMVSHEPSEIYRMAKRVIVLQNGKIIKDGSPKNVLLKTTGSQKFSFEGEILDIVKVDVIFIAIISIGQQIVEVVISNDEAKDLQIGDTVDVSTKAFAPNVTKAKMGVSKL